jgi:hypothetical protein
MGANIAERGKGSNSHPPIRPLSFLDNVQTRVDDELVHVLCRVREAESRNAIASTFGGAKGNIEEGFVGGGEDGEVV